MHILENNITLENNTPFEALLLFTKMNEEELSKKILEMFNPYLQEGDYFSIDYLIEQEGLNPVKVATKIFGFWGAYGHCRLALLSSLYFTTHKEEEEEEEEGTLMSEKEYAGMKLTSNKL